MKKLLFPFVLFLSSFPILAQDITGQWNGILKIPGGQLSLIFHLEKEGGKYTGTMDSPDQKSQGLPIQGVILKDSILSLDMTNFGITYDGKVKGQIIEGIFKQGGQAYPLNLDRKAVEKEKMLRPQEPPKPYPYYSEDVKFENKKDQISLAGTLTLPAKTGKYPAVILISGSGPQNRDEELAGHKPFLVISDYLTKNGIAVLRYDDRGTGQSTGKFDTAITPDFATDVKAALEYLKTRPEIDIKKIGLIGHSEGGLIAPMVASESKDVSFIVMLAGPGIPGDEILSKQSWLIGKANGLSDSIITSGDIVNRKIHKVLKEKVSMDEVKKQLTVIMEDALSAMPPSQQPAAEQKATIIAQKVNMLATPWFRYFVSYNPVPVLEKVKCPVLALNGANDLQVPPKENLEAIQTALTKAGNKNFMVKELPKLNHLFQESTTGSPSEYAVIEQTISPSALSEISNWIKIELNRQK